MKYLKSILLALGLAVGAATTLAQTPHCDPCFRIKIFGETSGSVATPPVANPPTTNPNQTPDPTGDITLSPAYLPQGFAGDPYTATVSASGTNGVTGPFTYVMEPLPWGIQQTSNDTISGNGFFGQTVAVQVTVTASGGQSATFERVIVLRDPVYAVANLALGKVGQVYPGGVIRAVAGTGGPYDVTVAGLPNGLQYDAGTGTVAGTPTQAGRFGLNITARDSSGRSNTVQASLTVETDALELIVQSTSPRPVERVGKPFAPRVLLARNAVGAPQYAVQSGLPPGMVVNDATGVVSGSPTATGTFDVVFRALDPAVTQTATAGPYRIVVEPDPGSAISVNYDIAELEPGKEVTVPAEISGGIPEEYNGHTYYSCQVKTASSDYGNSQSVMPGMALNGCDIVGTPQPGTYEFSIKVKDSTYDDLTAAERTFTVTVPEPKATDPWSLLGSINTRRVDQSEIFPLVTYVTATSEQRKQLLRDGDVGTPNVIGGYTWSGEEGGWDIAYTTMSFTQPVLIKTIRPYVSLSPAPAHMVVYYADGTRDRIQIGGSGWQNFDVSRAPIYEIWFVGPYAEAGEGMEGGATRLNGLVAITELQLLQ